MRWAKIPSMYCQNWSQIGRSSPFTRLKWAMPAEVRLGAEDGLGLAAGDQPGQEERDQDHADDDDERLADAAEEEPGQSECTSTSPTAIGIRDAGSGPSVRCRELNVHCVFGARARARRGPLRTG